MRSLVALLVLVAIASANPAFDRWASKYNKAYTATQKARRMAIFEANMKKLPSLRAEHPLATFGATQFADLTFEEFQMIHLGARPAKPAHVLPRQKASNDIPETWDWREAKNPERVNEVQNQASCGSCWAFSSTVYLEGRDAKDTGSLKKLSEQQLVDCDHECQDPEMTACDSGCNGGWLFTAMNYAIKNGMVSADDYPYKGSEGTCAASSKKVVARFKGNGTQLAAGDEEGLLNYAYNDGPMAVAVNANIAWQLYFGGVLSGTCSSTTLNHGVAVVAWGVDAKAGPFWTIRNSWGPSWGEEGHIRILRGKNHCGVAEAATVILP